MCKPQQKQKQLLMKDWNFGLSSEPAWRQAKKLNNRSMNAGYINKRTLKRIAIIFLSVVVIGYIVSFLLFRLGIIPTLDDPEIQEQATVVLTTARTILEPKGLFPEGELKLRETSKTRSPDGKVKGYYIFEIDGTDETLTVEWEQENAKPIVTSIRRSGSGVFLYNSPSETGN